MQEQPVSQEPDGQLTSAVGTLGGVFTGDSTCTGTGTHTHYKHVHSQARCEHTDTDKKQVAAHKG